MQPKETLNYKLLAETRSAAELAKFFYRQIDRWNHGIFLKKISGTNSFEIPEEFQGRNVWIEATFPVTEELVVIGLDHNGDEIRATPERNSGIGTQSIIARGTMILLLLKVNKERETATLSVRKINYDYDRFNNLIVKVRRLFHRTVPFSGKVFPKNFELTPDEWWSRCVYSYLIGACNTMNRMRQATVQEATKPHGVRKITMGVVSEIARRPLKC